MANEQREFSFTTRHFSLGETDVPLGDGENPDTTRASGISTSQNATFSAGAIEPDYTAIPDSGDLQIHYDASEQTDVSSTWNAEIGPDLSALGSPSVLTSEKNGRNVVQYQRSNGDGHVGSFGSAVSQPVHIFFVFRIDSTPTDTNQEIFSSPAADFRAQANGFTDNWLLSAGSNNFRGGQRDTNWHIGSFLFNSSNSTIRIDGSQVASGGPGANSWNGMAFAHEAVSGGSFGDVTIGECIGYPMGKSSIQADVETYLNDRWAVF